jgi:outer membrane protein OmpA-like peptidoglycan-associated protein
MKIRFLSSLILVVAVVCFAQTGLMGGSDGIHQINTRTLGTGQIIAGTGGNITLDPWALSRGGVYYNDGEKNHFHHYKLSATGNFFGGIGLTEYADIGAALNINYDMAYADGYWDAASKIRQGDLALWAKARAPFGDSSVFTLAGQFELYLPIGVRSAGIRPRHAWYIRGNGETHPFTANEVVVGMSAITTVDLSKVNIPVRWNANIGFVYADEGANTVVYGTGLDWDVFSWATPFVEFSGEFRVEDNGMPIDIMEDPMLLTPGLRLHLPWNIELAGGIDLSVRMLRNRYNTEKEMKNTDAYTIGYTDQKGYHKTYGYTPTVTYALTGVLTWKFGFADALAERECPQGLPRVDTLVKVDTLFKVDTVVVTDSIKDADGDGIIDSLDMCPNTEAGVEVDSMGCVKDFDKDGVDDLRDKCPDTEPGVAIGRDGCPLDFDQDGVPNYKDMCPNTRPNTGVDSLGCDKDEDKDGVADGRDQCPLTPKDAPVDTTGCPMDTDKDSIPDYLDKCPNSVRGVKIDKNGCPVNKKEDLDKLKTGINFKSGSTILTKPSYGTLDDIVYLMQKFADVNLEIQGHTDNVGDTEYNENLSQGRAQSVVDYMIRKGIKVNRLRAVGYGPHKPIADNKTKKGRAKNRRVELVPFYMDE